MPNDNQLNEYNSLPQEIQKTIVAYLQPTQQSQALIDDVIYQPENLIRLICNLIPVTHGLTLIKHYRASPYFKQLKEKYENAIQTLTPAEIICYAMVTESVEQVSYERLNEAIMNLKEKADERVWEKLNLMLSALQCNLIEDIQKKIDLIRETLRASSYLEHYLFTKFINLANTNLSEKNFASMNLSGFNLNGANLTKANLRANLSKTQLSNAILKSANLSRSLLSEANLSFANLEEANLTFANLERACLQGVNLSRANMEVGVEMRGANLSRANLTEANLTGADLREVNFSNADLTGADLTIADFRGANFSGATLKNVTFLWPLVEEEEEENNRKLTSILKRLNIIIQGNPQQSELRRAIADNIVRYIQNKDPQLALSLIKTALNHPIFTHPMFSYDSITSLGTSIGRSFGFFVNSPLSDKEILLKCLYNLEKLQQEKERPLIN